jgi:ectoine hydroxylase-related dioxygenase (phytanoyl-CoA dioxygenase family)
MHTDQWFNAIREGCQLPAAATEELRNVGFVVIPGPVAPKRLTRFAAAYDAAMNSGDAADVNVGRTTTRMYDFVNRSAEFDDLYIYPPLLEACQHIIGAPFKLSTTVGRTLRPYAAAQDLHVDIPRGSDDLPMVGFILMIDGFRPDNGATRFVPGSHKWPGVPGDVMHDCRTDYEGQVSLCGPAGSLIIFNGSVWHGHTANESATVRRSIQGYFVRREARAGIDLYARMRPETLERIGPLARYMLSLPT